MTVSPPNPPPIYPIQDILNLFRAELNHSKLHLPLIIPFIWVKRSSLNITAIRTSHIQSPQSSIGISLDSKLHSLVFSEGTESFNFD